MPRLRRCVQLLARAGTMVVEGWARSCRSHAHPVHLSVLEPQAPPGHPDAGHLRGIVLVAVYRASYGRATPSGVSSGAAETGSADARLPPCRPLVSFACPSGLTAKMWNWWDSGVKPCSLQISSRNFLNFSLENSTTRPVATQ